MSDKQKRKSSSPLAPLVVLDTLEVGPPRLQPARLVMPYTVHRGGGSETINLIYRWGEDVFDPSEEASQNLAAMVGAQVALNYGLFCKRIVFRGVFGDPDRRFIQEMIENTSREIYVKKFLEPNPFLAGDAFPMKPQKLAAYTQAELDFPDLRSARSPAWTLWRTDREKYAVLSSGGKDSLLSHGLLSELGKKVYPIFANESGRHWFTALNAFRHFEKSVPDTKRVWMNSDRVFAAMLRHLPFVRPDFASVRADEYPIRLWTVAVFIFGALPLVRKYGMGRVVIGDEFDTTARSAFQGIPHYDGLYDQSRHFDNAMSRYYLRKGWSVSQFSLLRPLSELLIQKTLVERYPELQRLQMSCHATHTEGDHVRPCGKCEKCRRIVGMLVALGADATRCGYTKEQIDRCLIDVAEKGVHQEGPGRQHLLYMLAQRQRVPQSAEARKSLKPVPEVIKLRFDPRRSRIDGIPVDLRRPVLRILLAHADGALVREGRAWKPFDVLSDPAIEALYPYEMQAPAGLAVGSAVRGFAYLWGEMTWPQAERVLRRVDVALLPVGATEQHGPHLPLDTDAFDAEYMARRVAQACSDPKPVVLPVIPYGVSYHHEDFKGTVSISNDTLARLIYEVGTSLARNGIKKIVIINGHGGNAPALNYAAQMINRDAHVFVCVDTGETSDIDVHQIADTPNDVHAGEVETSTALATRPHLVHMAAARTSVPKFSSRYLDFTSQRGVPWHAHTSKISKSGVMGDPTKATAEKGKRIWEVMIAHMVAFVEDLKRMTLDEIYQRKY